MTQCIACDGPGQREEELRKAKKILTDFVLGIEFWIKEKNGMQILFAYDAKKFLVDYEA